MFDPAAQQKPVARHVFISGKVQGVGYRYATLQQANHLRIQGWVRNLNDGRVEAFFEGEQTLVEEMLSWCHTGPPGAVVQNVTVENQEVSKIQGFSIR